MTVADRKRIGKRIKHILRNGKSVTNNTISINIDCNEFKDGYDPLVNKIDYGYTSMGKITVPEQNQLSKLKYSKTAVVRFNEWLNNKEGEKGRSGKQKPYIYKNLKKIDVCEHEFGECLIGAANGSDFKVRFLNNKGSDSYVHHVSILANSENKNCIHSMDMIKTVCVKKNDPDARSISHLCGNGGCARPGHLRIEPKRINDERNHCHFLLRRCKSILQSNVIRDVCPHTPKCFVNIYKINKPYY